ncbi:NADH-quinone oxidoreductase subunit NuoE [Microbulbifer variabilis]|uniref:NADH-quinone oxidoreductase subunit E n=1 Tax=Microbulbifer variabilis TaxID=266805 RepID=A0ABY4VE08_9GAMM|nr:NADH-quinone oxidoreductase subunit NuoE [Microbulbifer variabilis]USD22486.1 NADH-quinone oxidoreductase subunit NuoE [Microbulbifer variabilis]
MSSVLEPELIEVMEQSNKDPEELSETLTDEEKREIDEEASHYEGKSSVGLEALRIVQKYRGWISDGSLQAIANYLDMPVAQLESVATYFQLIFRQPVGKEVILLCKSASCWVMGCDQLQKHISQSLQIEPGQTTKDGIFTLLEAPCLGDCDKAPVLMLGEEMYRNLDESAIDALIDKKKQIHADKSSH